MITNASRLTLTAMVLAAACVATAPAVAAASGKSKGEKTNQEQRPSVDPETLRKYDKNGNGRLDPDEEAAMKADQAKQRARENKKHGQAGN